MKLCAAVIPLVLGLASAAHAADRELLTKAGEAGTLAIDQLSGFRATSTGGVGYAAPIGFSYQSTHLAGIGTGPAYTQKTTTFYLAPSADVFVLDGLSVGALVEFAWQKSSYDVLASGGGGASLPATTRFTLLPRIGYLLRIGDRVAIWPRVGVGYGKREVPVDSGATSTTKAMLVDLDVGILYRIDETFFLRVAPELTLSPTGSTSLPIQGGSGPSHTTSLELSSTVGLGVFWEP